MFKVISERKVLRLRIREKLKLNQGSSCQHGRKVPEF